MESDSASLNRTKYGKIWLPFILIMIGVALALIALIYAIFYEDIYRIFYSSNLSLIITIIYSLISPFIMLGIALFLLILIEPKKGVVAWSILIFFFGTVLFMLGGMLAIMIQYAFYYNPSWLENNNSWMTLSQAEMIANISGIILCTITGLFLVRAYLKGEVRAKHLGAS